MSQRNSEYKRRPLDAYYTPPWVVQALVHHITRTKRNKIWEPACGNRSIVKALQNEGYTVHGTDIKRGRDFLKSQRNREFKIIVTNPPYRHAEAFIMKALDLVYPEGMVAMLLRIDFDSGSTRKHMFAGHPAWHKKIVLTRRIRWIENSTGHPSENHAWYIWDWWNCGLPPTIAYE